MVYAQYYTNAVNPQGIAKHFKTYLVERLGSDGVFYIDGRYGIQRTNEAAKQNALQLIKIIGAHILAFRIFKGRSFMDSQPIGPMVRL